MNESLKDTKKDIFIIVGISLVSAIVYIAFGGRIMEYGKELSHPLILRFLPVFCLQFGMSCMGIGIVLLECAINSRLSGSHPSKKNSPSGRSPLRRGPCFLKQAVL